MYADTKLGPESVMEQSQISILGKLQETSEEYHKWHKLHPKPKLRPKKEPWEEFWKLNKEFNE